MLLAKINLRKSTNNAILTIKIKHGLLDYEYFDVNLKEKGPKSLRKVEKDVILNSE